MTFDSYMNNLTYVSNMYRQAARAAWDAAIEAAAAIADGWDRPPGYEDLPLDIRDRIMRMHTSKTKVRP
jgi:hypothetical protein